MKLFNDQNAGLGGKIAGIYAVLAVANVLAWLWALIAFHDYPVLIGTAFLAYTFGLRHAVDADHIAAIDNVTRKLMQEGKRPVAVGFFFSLGHSTIVVATSAAIAVATASLEGRFQSFKLVGGTIGTLVSVVFLFLVAAANFMILCAVYRTFRAVRRGKDFVEEDLDHLLAQRGFLGRLFRPVFRLVERSWHMYPLGVLFGLGFDTAKFMFYEPLFKEQELLVWKRSQRQWTNNRTDTIYSQGFGQGQLGFNNLGAGAI